MKTLVLIQQEIGSLVFPSGDKLIPSDIFTTLESGIEALRAQIAKKHKVSKDDVRAYILSKDFCFEVLSDKDESLAVYDFFYCSLKVDQAYFKLT